MFQSLSIILLFSLPKSKYCSNGLEAEPFISCGNRPLETKVQ